MKKVDYVVHSNDQASVLINIKGVVENITVINEAHAINLVELLEVVLKEHCEKRFYIAFLHVTSSAETRTISLMLPDISAAVEIAESIKTSREKYTIKEVSKIVP